MNKQANEWKKICISFTATVVSVESIVVEWSAVKLHRSVSFRVAMQHAAANSPVDRYARYVGDACGEARRQCFLRNSPTTA